MLSKENSDKILEKHKIEDFRDKIKKNLNKLSRDAKKIGLLLLDDNSVILNSSNWTEKEEKKIKDIREIFDKQPDKYKPWTGELFKTLEAIFDKNAEFVKCAWDLQDSLPYQNSYYRRSFRSKNPEHIIKKKIEWLSDIIHSFNYDFNIAEYATYAGYINSYYDRYSHVLAAAIDSNTEKGNEVYQILLDTIYGRDDVTMVNKSAIKALLLCSKPEAWEAVEKLLLSAQRQEGLRQTILECLDETNIEAHKRIIKLIINEKLARFSSVVRAVDVWFGFNWEAAKEKTIYKILESALEALEKPETITEKLESEDNLIVYTALWASGVNNIEDSYELIQKLLENKNADKRVLALYFLNEISLGETTRIAEPYLTDENLKVVSWALKNCGGIKEKEFPETFGKFVKLLERVPQKGINYEGEVFSWLHFSLDQSDIYRVMIDLVRQNNTERIIPFIEKMDADRRYQAVSAIISNCEIKGEIRDLLFNLLGDKSSWVRNTVYKSLNKLKLEKDENLHIENLLKRKSANLRKANIEILLKQKDEEVEQTVIRLLGGNVEQRLACFDMVNQMINKKRNADNMKLLTKEYVENAKKITEKEQIIIDNIFSEEVHEYSFENAFGLINSEDLTISPKPNKTINLLFDTKIVEKELHKLNDLIEKHKDYEYEAKYRWSDETYEVLIGNNIEEIEKGDKTTLPLEEVWLDWFENSKLDLKEICKIINSSNIYGYSYWDEIEKEKIPKWLKELTKKYYNQLNISKKFSYGKQIKSILYWLAKTKHSSELVDYLLDATETTFAAIPEKHLNDTFKTSHWSNNNETWRDYDNYTSWFDYTISSSWNKHSDLWNGEQVGRLWHLMNWNMKSSKTPEKETTPGLMLTSEAIKSGKAKIEDLYYLIILNPSFIRKLTLHEKRDELLDKYDFLDEIVNKCRERILEIELKRGDSKTIASEAAKQIDSIYGIEYLVRILKALGKEKLQRTYAYEDTQKSMLSHFLQVSYPLKNETQEDFNKLISEAKIDEQRLVEIAVYTPQWASFVENYLNWKGLREGIWWFHAHTKSDEYDIKNKFESDISRYTPLSSHDLVAGAVDVEWFKKDYKLLGKKRWDIIYDAAKYTAGSGGHKRAQLFADCMLNKVKVKEIIPFIEDKRRQDYLRAFGLVPLNSRNKSKDLLSRYQIATKFLKESKQFGSQRQASESLAVRICLENLARTAGYADPVRLTWAMETKEAQQIIKESKELKFDETIINLVIDDLGQAHIEVEKAGKKLKSIPAKLKKEAKIKALQENKKLLKNQYSRTRKSLEEAMCRGDEFSCKEMRDLQKHPIVAPMLKNLVFVTIIDKNVKVGYLSENVKTLIVPNKEAIELSAKSKLRVAHCTDLHASEEWSNLQHDCFANKKVQPFKQIFRELYLPTTDEKKEKTSSRRYAGHQVQPRKTVSLLKGRGWTVDYEDGLQKVYHNEGFVVTIYAQADWFTPADTESPTLETVQFYDRDTWKEIPIEKIKAPIFSEIMRDLDLVVSVAHAGGVDPEASHSTIEMRSVMLTESSKLLGLENVTLNKNHATIKGTIGDYSVHLGSGTVHRMPGGYISILPVHSSHRGRIFLPFVDDDPKTAEIISKVLLLSKDNEIKDPTILAQLNS